MFVTVRILQAPTITDVRYNPPYEKNLGEKAISILLKYGWVKRNAIFVLEKEIKSELSCDLKLIDQRKYGKTEINILCAFDFKI